MISDLEIVTVQPVKPLPLFSELDKKFKVTIFI